ncbi:chaplin family protein [Streptomyces ziwulingensis]
MSRGMVAAAAATSVLSLCGSPALADAQADGVAKKSSGAFSGNVVQVPVNAPVNACGNTVDAAAALNPSFGNKCGPDADEREDDDSGYGEDDDSGYGEDDDSGYGEDDDSGYGADDDSGYGADDGSDSAAESLTDGSSGIGSGNVVEVPVSAPVNACGNTVNVVGALNPVAGNGCAQGGYGDDEATTTTPPPTEDTPPPANEEEPAPADEQETPPSGGEDAPQPAGEESVSPADAGHEAASLPETGSGGLLGAATASAGLIAGGALLYRRNRVASGR